MTVQQSVSRKDIAKFLRKSFIMLMLIILATMVVNIAYTGGYASVITRPLYQNSIDTLEDFLKSDLPWGSLQIADWIKAWKYEGIVIVFILRFGFSVICFFRVVLKKLGNATSVAVLRSCSLCQPVEILAF